MIAREKSTTNTVIDVLNTYSTFVLFNKKSPFNKVMHFVTENSTYLACLSLSQQSFRKRWVVNPCTPPTYSQVPPDILTLTWFHLNQINRRNLIRLKSCNSADRWKYLTRRQEVYRKQTITVKLRLGLVELWSLFLCKFTF